MHLPQRKMNTNFLILLFPFVVSAQTNILSSYYYVDKNFSYKLELNVDSTFIYDQVTRQGATKAIGKWQQQNDTIILYNYQKPWKILYGHEAHIDTLMGSIIVELTMDTVDKVTFSEDKAIYYIDGLTVQSKFDKSKTEESKSKFRLADFEIWLDNKCQSKNLTDINNKVAFRDKIASVINLEYDNYKIKNSYSNYFLLYFSGMTLRTSPKDLQWSKWLLKDRSLVPLECNELIDYLELIKN